MGGEDPLMGGGDDAGVVDLDALLRAARARLPAARLSARMSEEVIEPCDDGSRKVGCSLIALGYGC